MEDFLEGRGYWADGWEGTVERLKERYLRPPGARHGEPFEPRMFESHLFEVNPLLDDPLRATADRLRASKRARIVVHNQTALWSADSVLDIHIDTANEERNFWGTSVLANEHSVTGSHDRVAKVRALDLAAFLQSLNVRICDYVVLKVRRNQREHSHTHLCPCSLPPPT